MKIFAASRQETGRRCRAGHGCLGAYIAALGADRICRANRTRFVDSIGVLVQIPNFAK